MRVGIVDADLIGRHKHRFPNLACMKISGYHKAKGDEVTLVTEYFKSDKAVFQKYYNRYDKIYVSKVFVDTPVPYDVLNLSITEYGGSGFFYANAEPLLPEIEHHMPDYHLYDDWIKQKREEGKVTDREFLYYEEYSIGYTSRKCIRQCKFCINQNSTKVEEGSPVKEFLDESRQRICLLDDNILAYEKWEEVFKELNSTGKMFEYKQGFDIRALNDKKAMTLVNSNFYKTYLYFAFDNIKDKDIIEEKIKLWKKYYKKHINMYILCAFDENNEYNETFWSKDIENTLERIKICIKYGIFPFIMRYRKYNSSPEPFRGMYINLGSWCNQRHMFAKQSLNEWADTIQKANEKQLGKKELFSSKRYLFKYAGQFPEVAYKYFDLKYNINTDAEYRYEKNSKLKEDEEVIEVFDEFDKINVADIYRKENDSKDNYGKKEQQKVIFSIKHNKKSIKILKVDKTRIKKEKIKIPLNLSQEQNISQLDIINWVKHPQQKFKDGVVVKFNHISLKAIPENSGDLLLINFKNDSLEDSDKLLLCYSEKYLKENGNLYIYNTDLKSFTFTKEFIEKNTNFKFNEVATFVSLNSKLDVNRTKIQYCSRYSLNIDNKKVFNINNTTRSVLLDEAIKQTTKENDIILSFFESYNYLEKLGNIYKRQWFCLKKRKLADTQSAMKFLNIEINKDTNNSQMSLLDTENKNIG